MKRETYDALKANKERREKRTRQQQLDDARQNGIYEGERIGFHKGLWEAQANGVKSPLVKAAPDLLNELKACRQWLGLILEDGDCYLHECVLIHDDLKRADSAIAKAEGRQQ